MAALGRITLILIDLHLAATVLALRHVLFLLDELHPSPLAVTPTPAPTPPPARAPPGAKAGASPRRHGSAARPAVGHVAPPNLPRA